MCRVHGMHLTTLTTCLIGFWLCVSVHTSADDWPMLGRDGSRNSVSPEKNPPTVWSVEQPDKGRLIRAARGVRWSTPLGSETYSSPVVAGGFVWIGTNDNKKSLSGSMPNSVLKCFRASDGAQVYEYNSPWLGTRNYDAGWTGLGSSPLVEGDRLWITTNRSEVLCLDIGPLSLGEGMPRELWKLDFVKEFNSYPRVPLMGPPRPCSIGASWNDRIFVTINHGIGYDETKVANPEAPSLVCLNKFTGAVIWKDNSPGENILRTQFSSPTLATIQGQVQVIVPQSDGWVRAFDPNEGRMLWEFDMNYKASLFKNSGQGSRNSILANAVVYNDRVYIASGQEPEQGTRPGRMVCIDPTKGGDLSSELAVDTNGKLLPKRRLQAIDVKAGDSAIPNPNSALIWEFTNCGTDYSDIFHTTIGSVAVARDLVIATDSDALVHCFDANTGHRVWFHELKGVSWGTPLIVDDKAFVTDDDGTVTVFQLGADPKHAKPVSTVSHPNGINSSLAYANGTLYIAARNTLYAIEAAEANRLSATTGYWPQWRGQNRDNRSTETGLLKSWPDKGPPLIWRVDGLGDGIASLAISEKRIFTSTTIGEAEYAVALDEDTGETLWSTEVSTAVKENLLMRWLSQRTPTVDGNRVYIFTNTGWLVCLDANNGQVKWRTHYPTEFGTKQGKWGFCDRPLIDGEKLICTPGGTNATVVALDKHTGQRLWSRLLENNEPFSYAAPLQIATDGLRQYVVFLSGGIVSFAANDGRVLWRYDKIATRLANTYTPLALDDGLLCANGYSSGLARLKLVRENDKVTYKEQYFQKQSFDAFEDSSILVDGHMYAFLSNGLPACIDIKSGKTVWQARGSGKGKAAATYADGHLYIRWSDGTIGLVEDNPTAYVEKNFFKLDEPRNGIGSTFPVIASGCLYLRDNDRLYKYDVSQRSVDAVLPEPRVITMAKPEQSKRQHLPSSQRGAKAIFVPTPMDVVAKMLEIAKVGKEDVVVDLGSGDGRILIEAANKHGCRAIGIEIDPELVKISKQRIQDASLNDLVTITEADLFEAEFGDATVVTAYLYSDLLKRLLPKFGKLKPGSRIVTHQFAIPGISPDETVRIVSQETGAEHTIYLWTTPLLKSPKKD